MQISGKALNFIAVLVVLIATAASQGETPVGESGNGVVLLGDGKEVTMSFSTPPSGATLDPYVRGINPSTKTKTDTIGITSNAHWDLTIADSNIATSSMDGKMRKHNGSAYDSPDVGLRHGFYVGIAGETLNDLSASSGSMKILNNQKKGTAISKIITYSQEFDSINDATVGTYRIDLTYSIAYNPSG